MVNTDPTEPAIEKKRNELPESDAPESEINEIASETELENLHDELEQAVAESQERWQKLLRSQAELENLRKRGQRDLENAHKYAIEKFAGELLSVRDSLELGLGHSSEEADAQKLHEGMELTLKMLTQVMEKFSIEQIDPSGEVFDPEFHQAMTIQESTELASNTVMSVMQKGYALNGRLLRPAMVIVSKLPDGSD